MNYNSESIPPSVQIVLSDLLALYAAELEKAYNTIREMEQSNWLFTVIKKRKRERECFKIYILPYSVILSILDNQIKFLEQ